MCCGFVVVVAVGFLFVCLFVVVLLFYFLGVIVVIVWGRVLYVVIVVFLLLLFVGFCSVLFGCCSCCFVGFWVVFVLFLFSLDSEAESKRTFLLQLLFL